MLYIVKPCVFFLRATKACHALRTLNMCMFSNCDDGITCLTSSDHVFITRAMMACHANIVLPYMLSKGDESMPRPTLSIGVCNPKAIRACHVDVI